MNEKNRRTPPSSKQIRQDFLDFFRARGHEIVAPASLIPGDDPTLLFTNSGMAQFKDVFLGTGKRSYTRAADSQKCMRVSGKHNDLEDVGRDHYHHTLFEMLGNWSFGDYYKKDAIEWAWTLLTEVWKIPADRLHATVYQTDDEAYELWLPYVVDEAHISRHGNKDNFWEMGETGPCGPCTEIHFDLGEARKSVADSRPNVDDNRFREIWNLVFIQNERHPDGSLTDLPDKHVDTGMGFERLVGLLHGTHSNYATDLFQPYIQWVARETGAAYGEGPEGMPHRVIADHLRAVAFAVADGVVPSNEGRGYVIRRVLRRAARYGRQLGLEKPFLHRMVPLLVEVMGEAFPELAERSDAVTQMLLGEEERFSDALGRGMKIFEAEAGDIEAKGGKQIPAATVFSLYDTHGFPMDLTRLLARERGMTIDEPGFEVLVEENKDRTRRDSHGFKADEGAKRCAEGLPATEFTGYQTLSGEYRVLRAVPIDDAQGEWYVALDQTPCYAESGGQVADVAMFEGRSFRAWLRHATKVGDVFVHRVVAKEGRPTEGERVHVQVDPEARARTACNHTATHLLHAALKRVLGGHVQQAGSLVAPDRLRFDFVHPKALTDQEIAAVERLVNQQIARDQGLEVCVVDRAAADAKGAVALFGEKYGDRVRVVEVPGFSTELCGGTHVDRTGRILRFSVLAQSSVAANVRRVDCLAGPALLDHLDARSRLLDRVAAEAGAAPEAIGARIEALNAEIKKLKKELAQARKAGAGLDPKRVAADADVLASGKTRRPVRLAREFPEGLEVDALRDLSDAVMQQLGSGVVVLSSGGLVVCKVSDDHVAAGDVSAGDLVRHYTTKAGGKGGGRPGMATGSAPDAARLRQVIESEPNPFLVPSAG